MEYAIVPYFTEMYFWARGSKVFVLGPGNPELAHTDNERVSKMELERAAEIYLDIIKKNQNRR